MVDSSTYQESVVLERVFDAPIELVWKMWTDPAGLHGGDGRRKRPASLAGVAWDAGQNPRNHGGYSRSRGGQRWHPRRPNACRCPGRVRSRSRLERSIRQAGSGAARSYTRVIQAGRAVPSSADIEARIDQLLAIEGG